MEGLTSIEKEQIGALGTQGSVEFFGDLLFAEARRLGISPEIRISSRTNVPDGGIDASVNHLGTPVSDLVKSGYSGYQIKSGTTFKLTEAKLKEELFGQGKSVAKENLGASVIHCLDANGNLTFVCFGLDPVESEINTAVGLIKGWLQACGYQNPTVHIFGQSTLKGFLEPFPSLLLRVNGHGAGGFKIFDSWKTHGDMSPEVLSLGEAQNKVIEEIRSQLLNNTEAIHLRITGESGIGKTRLTLEALSDEKIRPLVVYTDNPSQLEHNNFFSYVGMPDNTTEVVLVVDECSQDVAVHYWNKLQSLGKRIRLVTIYNEASERSGTTKLIPLPPLADDQIANILKEYDIPNEHLRRWSSFCEGSPRWAKMIGENLKNNERDILTEPDNVSVVNRCIAGTDNINSQDVQDRMLIMRYLSLFKRVGNKAPVANEAEAVFNLIKKYDSSLTRARFDRAIENLHNRRILQGEKTYYITPKPLQVKLWIDWWDKHSSSAFNIADFTSLPQPLVAGFNDMFRFAQESEAAMKTVEFLLGAEGPFADGELLIQETGGDFFLALTEAAPDKALQRLEATVGTWSNDKLLSFKAGRRDVISAVERIAVWEGLFVRAAKVLLRLAETENDTVYSNNSTGTFKELFSVFSPTEEPVSHRLPLIIELVESTDPKKQKIGIGVMSVALEDHFTRVIGAEYQGIRREPRIWDPRANPDETRDYLHKIWEILVKSADTVAPENKKAVSDVLQHEIHAKGRHPLSSQLALDAARTLFAKGTIDKNMLIETTVHIRHYGHDELSPEMLKKWDEFYSELVPEDLSSQLNRYVGMQMIEDSFRVRGEYDEEDKTKRITRLAAQSLENQEEFLKNLPWLVTYRPGNGYAFGYELGKQDKDKTLLKPILDARRKSPATDQPNQFFLGGYLRTIFEEDPKQWESLFEELSKEEMFVSLLPELAWRSGVTDKIMEHILSLVEKGTIEFYHMEHFKYGTYIREISDEMLAKFVRVMIAKKQKRASSIALDVFSRYFVDKESGHEMPKELALEVLTDPSFFIESDGYSDTMNEFIWAQVAKKFLEKFGDDKDQVVKVGYLMLDNIGNSGSILDHIDREVKDILTKISETYPDEMWLRALNKIEEKGYFIFKHWLSSNRFFSGPDQVESSILQKIKLNVLWAWVDADIEKRAWFIASLVPNNFTNAPGEVCLAREVLIKYGDREDVRRNLHANFFSEGWSGKASDHHQSRLNAILPLRASETDPKVLKWLDEYIDRRKKSIENSKTGEERDDFWA
jgi:hypothetical protein